MITVQELNPKAYPLTAEQKVNFDALFEAVNILRQIWGQPMTVTSGVRSWEDHERIYKEINDKRKAQGIPPLRVPKASKHLYTMKDAKGAIVPNPAGASAVDISDPKGKLDMFCLRNLSLLEQLGLYLEDPLRTPGWCHLQVLPPASGNRVFQP